MLRITLLGSFQASFESVQELKLTGTIRRLFAYLLLQHYRPQPRALLADLFWGDQTDERAHKCLNTALWRLRSMLELQGAPNDSYLVNSNSGEIAFNRDSHHWIDLVVFEETAHKLLSKPVDRLNQCDEDDFRKLQQLYRGDLLESFYDDWALRAREYIRKLYVDTLGAYMCYEQYLGHLPGAIELGTQILDMDPLREEIHRDLIRLYLRSGQRTLAIRQYLACAELLERELGILPLAETQQLYSLCLEASSDQSLVSPSSTEIRTFQAPDPFRMSTGIEEIWSQLEQLNMTLNVAKEELGHIKRLIENLKDQPLER